MLLSRFYALSRPAREQLVVRLILALVVLLGAQALVLAPMIFYAEKKPDRILVAADGSRVEYRSLPQDGSGICRIANTFGHLVYTACGVRPIAWNPVQPVLLVQSICDNSFLLIDCRQTVVRAQMLTFSAFSVSFLPDGQALVAHHDGERQPLVIPLDHILQRASKAISAKEFDARNPSLVSFRSALATQ